MANQKAIISEAASKYGIDPKILWGLYGTETSFGKNTSTSSAGAVGPFQFEPATAKSLGVDPYNFKSAAFGAARYLAQYKGRGVGGMLSAYNAGPAGGYQSGYVNTTLNNAKSYGGAPNLPVAEGGTRQRTIPGKAGIPGVPAKATFDEAGFKQAQGRAAVGKLLAAEHLPGGNPLLQSGLFSSREPSPAEFKGETKAQPAIPGTPARQVAQGGAGGGGKLGGFLGRSAPLEMKRIDQGQDIQTRPGEAILAPGAGTVVAVHSDPSGFGPDYPVVKFTSGPMAGTTWYIGHTDTALKQGDSFNAGQAIAHTSKTGHNAPPGWAELGFSSALGQGIHNQGAATRRYLKP